MQSFPYLTALASIIALAAISSASSGSKVGPYTVVYWKNNVPDCQGTNTTTVVIDQLNTCYKLNTAARSFNTGNTKHPKQIPGKYTLQGFPSCHQCKTDRESAVDFNVAEGSAADTCYIVALSSEKPVQCLWLVDAS